MCIAAITNLSQRLKPNTKEIKHKRHKKYPFNSRWAIFETIITELFRSFIPYFLVKEMSF